MRFFRWLYRANVKCLIVRNDPELIVKYIALHRKECHWKIARDGIKEVGILEMEIYRCKKNGRIRYLRFRITRVGHHRTNRYRWNACFICTKKTCC